MKFIRLYIIIAAFTGMLMSPAGAQPEGELTLEPVRNPFIPQLPEKPKIDETAAAQTQTQTQNQNQQNQGSVRTPNAEKGPADGQKSRRAWIPRRHHLPFRNRIFASPD